MPEHLKKDRVETDRKSVFFLGLFLSATMDEKNRLDLNQPEQILWPWNEAICKRWRKKSGDSRHDVTYTLAKDVLRVTVYFSYWLIEEKMWKKSMFDVLSY